MGTSQNQKGFTLIEMMVVVGIAGLLVAIAVPSYCKYASQSKQAQAMAVLGAIYTSEKTSVVQTGSFSACLADLGISSTTGGPFAYYSYGFNTNIIPAAGCGPTGLSSCYYTSWTGTGIPCAAGPGPAINSTWFQAGGNADSGPSGNNTIPGNSQLNGLPVSSQPPYAVTKNSFYAVAVGNISSCNSAYDRWTIDQNKNLINNTIAL